MTTSPRQAEIARSTTETQIQVSLVLDGSGRGECHTGIGFLDHLIISLVRHGRFDLRLKCLGDLQVDDHHTVEDCGIVLGQALDAALGERRGIARFGYAYAPLDEALSRCVVDLSGRPGAWIDMPFQREKIGDLSCENIPHLISSLAISARATLHLDLIRGVNAHHVAEASFKAVGLALRMATTQGGFDEIPSTKERLQ
jgi:imidazoleglycerol-phosphate dehydratase